MLIEYKFYPKHLGPEFLEVYSKIKDERIEAKHNGNKVKNETLKLALNGLKCKIFTVFKTIFNILRFN